MRVASRHPERVRSLFPEHPTVEAVGADINDENSTTAALAGAFAVINSVSLYVESGSETFRSVHVEAAGQVAAIASRARAEKLVHVSGIGLMPLLPPPTSAAEGKESRRCYEHIPRRR